MGDIADMMLDGTMCQGCGEWLCDGADGPGYPGYCSSCQPRREKPKKKPKLGKARRKRDGERDFPEVAAIVARLSEKYMLTVEWRNPGHPNYEIVFLRGEGVRLCIYPHTTTSTGNRHARIRNQSSQNAALAREIMVVSGFTVKAGGLPIITEEENANQA